jgi:hypothetical protein
LLICTTGLRTHDYVRHGTAGREVSVRRAISALASPSQNQRRSN